MLGARPRRRRLSGADALTPAELRVAELAAAGHSNPEIAQALFVSLRTVETHLTRSYAKLGIAGREQLPARFPPAPCRPRHRCSTGVAAEKIVVCVPMRAYPVRAIFAALETGTA